ncbi:MAG: peptidoglycan-binding protein, partial [Saccharothrix sp.]|nr:peptidoglycan-binding protein [Saccharothrix sp.]NUT91973.1 peptidoglycan-binding protein [Saccharothrix sp.]
GGYAVETADDRRLLPVKTGLFAKGKVEITGDGVTEGLKVVTTS